MGAMLLAVLLASCFSAGAAYGHNYSGDGAHPVIEMSTQMMIFICLLLACICLRAKEEVMRAYSGDCQHMYWVVPEIPFCCVKTQLQVPCPEGKHQWQRTYYSGDVLAVFSNGSYQPATFVRVDDSFFPPKAEFQRISGHPVPGAHGHGTPLLHVESPGGPESWLLSAAEMYGERYCNVAPPDFIGFAPASWHDIRQNLRTQVAASPPTAEPNQPGGVAGGCIIA